MKPFNDPDDPTPSQSLSEGIADGILMLACILALGVVAYAVGIVILSAR